MPVSVKLDTKKKLLTIKMPIETPRPSASGKTMLIASTRGVKSTDVDYSGRTVAVVANAFFYEDGAKRGKQLVSAEPLNYENHKEEEDNVKSED